jgi:ATP-binding cassette subfamily C protein
MSARPNPDEVSVRRVTVAALRHRPGSLALLAAWSLAEALPAVLGGYVTARAVDDGFLAGAPRVGLGWLGLLAVAVLVGAFGSRQCYRLLGGLVEPFRDVLLRRVAAGALRRSTTAGARPDTAAVSRLTHQVEIVRDTFGGLVMVIRGFLFAVAGALIGLLSLSPVIAALVTLPLLAGVAVFVLGLRSMVTRQREYVLAEEALAAGATTAVSGLRDVLACGAEEQVAAGIGQYVDAQAAAERAVARMAALRSLSIAVGGWLPLLLVLALAPWLAHRGLTAGAILGSLVYVLHGVQPALHTLVRGLGGGGLRYAVTLDRVLTASRAPASPTPSTVVHRPVGCGLVLREVTFSYGPWAEPVLRELDLVVPEGDHLAIVGPSGVGKSTLAALLSGVLRPQAGEILLGGAPVHDLDPATLAAHRVLIPQEAYVFTGTLRENLAYLRADLPEPELTRVVDLLGLRSLATKVGGFSATVDPGALSPGERQLIALARAYLSPARLVLLDEATCHLDPVAESTVEDAFARRPGSLLVIAHRVSSALRARRVLLLDGAHAVLGTHSQVLASSPLYRDLVGHWSGPSRSSPPRWQSAPRRPGFAPQSSR